MPTYPFPVDSVLSCRCCRCTQTQDWFLRTVEVSYARCHPNGEMRNACFATNVTAETRQLNLLHFTSRDRIAYAKVALHLLQLAQGNRGKCRICDAISESR